MIKLKIWHKLALAIITIVSIVLIIGILLIQNSFQRGFLNYLNSLESQRVERLAKRLKKDYQETGDWSFLPLQRGWRRYVDDALRPPRRDKNKPPQQRKPDHWQDRHRPPRHHNAPPPPRSHEDNQHRPKHHRPPPRPKTMFHDLASKEDIGQTERSDTKVYISLYSHDKKLILGIEQDSNTVIQYPIYLDKQRLAYLYIKPFTKLTSQLDQDFVKQQQGSFVKIMLFAFVITLLGAWLLALYFRKRIAPLTQIATQLSSGNYQYRTKIKQKDELGQLAIDLNHLGKTLQQTYLKHFLLRVI
jgi:two-component system sensor histidine kinase BaeS